MKKFLIAAALVAMIATAAYAAPPLDKGKPENPGKSNAHKAGENGNANNPAKACKKERTDLGVDAFNKQYGTNHNLKNAFGKCVSGKAKTKTKTEGKDEAKEDDQDASNAAKQCKKERSDMGAEPFKARYGTNANKANAFGKCVSSKSKKSGESDDD